MKTLMRGLRRPRGPAEAPRSMLLPSPRSDLRVTWHRERDTFVVSVWHGDDCVGSAPLGPAESAELAAFIATHLAERPPHGG